MRWNFSEVTPTRRTRSVMLPPLIQKSEQVFHLEICWGDMKERHDNASKKGNSAHGRHCRRTGQRHGKAFNSLEKTATCHRCQASPHPISEQLRLHQQKQPKSVSPTTTMKQTQEVVDALELLRSDTHKEDTKHNAVTAHPKIGTRFSPGDFFWGGDMKERHDNASKKGNSAHGRSRHRTGQRHDKAFASIFTSPTQAPPH
uniref:Uncharacterized protein n=1 Tax=Oryza rufipogon TaxID=4529 RepID=A0A0E0R8N7_ORYRU